jgi:beta-exotoxin I transport system permease protein
MALQALLLTAAVTVCVFIGRGFQLTVGPGNTVATAAALTLMGLDFGLVTMAVGAATSRRGTALGIGTGLAAASYLLSSLATTISAIRPDGTCRSSTGRSATTRSARESASPTSQS